MKTLSRLWRALEQVVGGADYTRYCAHLREHYPGQLPPAAKEFYLMRLKERYSRPTRCC